MITKFALFDMANFATPVRRIVPPILVVLVAALASPWPAFGIGGTAIIMSLLAPNPFAADERGHLDTLYATLPISRRTVVVGRYVALVMLYLMVALIATLAAIIIPIVEGKPIGFEVVGLVNAAGFLVFSIAIAVQLPFFFAVGFTRARPMMYIPVAVLAGGAWLASQTGMLDHLDLASTTSLSPAVLWIPALIAAVVVLLISVGISSTRYRRRAL